MQKVTSYILLLMLIVSTLYLPSTFAQDYTRWVLPRGVKTRFGKGYVNDIQYSQDSSIFAVATSIGIWIYDANTFQELILLTDYSYGSNKVFGADSISFSEDGQTLASGTSGDITLWDIPNKRWKMRMGRGKISSGSSKIAFCLNGKTLAHADLDGIELWDADIDGGHRDLTNERMIYRKVEHAIDIKCISFSPDGNVLATGNQDGTIHLWDKVKGEHLRTLTGHTAVVTSISFSPDGKTLASGSKDKTILLWDVNTGEQRNTLRGHKKPIYSVSFSPDGKTLASGGDDKIVYLWDVDKGQHKQVLMGNAFWMNKVLFSPDGKSLAVVSRDHSIYLYDTATGINKQIHIEHALIANNVVFSPDGQTFAIVCRDHSIHIWDAALGIHLQTLTSQHIPNEQTKNMIPYSNWTISPDSAMFAGGNPDGSISLWDVNSAKHKFLIGHNDSVQSVAFSPDGRIFASGSKDKTIRIWDVATGKHKDTLRNQGMVGKQKQNENTVAVSSVSFNPDSRLLASGSMDGSIKIWDLETGDTKHTLAGHTQKIIYLTFSPDGTVLASVSIDGTLSLWDVTTGSHKRTLGARKGTIWSVSFTPDGVPFAGEINNNVIFLWQVEKGTRKKVLIGQGSPVSHVSFSPDGRTLSSTSADGTV
ncbi:WD40 repeat domain-containing protein, partial [Candidatus Poribacteria bacterium]|nr:WD40 repeat domain-containing protein [Candidatus Poribacteria bacterium]